MHQGTSCIKGSNHKDIGPNGESPLHASRCQAGDEEPLEADEKDDYWNEAEYGHGEHVAPLGELVLSKEASYCNRQGPEVVVVYDGVRPRILLPRRQEVEDGDRCYRWDGKRESNVEVYSEIVQSIYSCSIDQIQRNVLHEPLYHECGERNHPSNIERDKPQKLVYELQFEGKLELRDDQSGTGDYHGHDYEREEDSLSFEIEDSKYKGKSA